MKFKYNKVMSFLVGSCLLFSNQSYAEDNLYAEQYTQGLQQRLNKSWQTQQEFTAYLDQVMSKLDIPTAEITPNILTNDDAAEIDSLFFLFDLMHDPQSIINQVQERLNNRQASDSILQGYLPSDIERLVVYQFNLKFKQFFSIDENHRLYQNSAGFVNLANADTTIEGLKSTIITELKQLYHNSELLHKTLEAANIQISENDFYNALENIYQLLTYNNDALSLYKLVEDHPYYNEFGNAIYGSDTAMYYQLYLSRLLLPKASEAENDNQFIDIVSQHYGLRTTATSKADFLDGLSDFLDEKTQGLGEFISQAIQKRTNIIEAYDYLQGLSHWEQERLNYPDTDCHRSQYMMGSRYYLKTYELCEDFPYRFTPEQKQAYKNFINKEAEKKLKAITQTFAIAWDHSPLLRPYKEAFQQNQLNLYTVKLDIASKVEIGGTRTGNSRYSTDHEISSSYQAFIIKPANSTVPALLVNWSDGQPIYTELNLFKDNTIKIKRMIGDTNQLQLMFEKPDDFFSKIKADRNRSYRIQAYAREFEGMSPLDVMTYDINRSNQAKITGSMYSHKEQFLFFVLEQVPFVSMGKCLYKDYLNQSSCTSPTNVTLEVLSVLPTIAALGKTVVSAGSLIKTIGKSIVRRNPKFIRSAASQLSRNTSSLFVHAIDDATMINIKPIMSSLRSWGSQGNVRLMTELPRYRAQNLQGIPIEDMPDFIIEEADALNQLRARMHREQNMGAQAQPSNSNTIVVQAEIHPEPVWESNHKSTQTSTHGMDTPSSAYRPDASDVAVEEALYPQRIKNTRTTGVQTDLDDSLNLTPLQEVIDSYLGRNAARVRLRKTQTMEHLSGALERKISRVEAVITEAGKMRNQELINELNETAAKVIKPSFPQSQSFPVALSQASDIPSVRLLEKNLPDLKEYVMMNDRQEKATEIMTQNSRRSSGEYDSAYGSLERRKSTTSRDLAINALTPSHLKMKALQDARIKDFDIEQYNQMIYANSQHGLKFEFTGLYAHKNGSGYAIESNGHYYRVVRKHTESDSYWDVHVIETRYRNYFDANDELYLATNKYDRKCIWKVRIENKAVVVDDLPLNYADAHLMKEGIHYNELPATNMPFEQHHAKALLNSDDEVNTFANSVTPSGGQSDGFHAMERHVNMNDAELLGRLESGTKTASVFDLTNVTDVSHPQRQYLRAVMTSKHLLKLLNENRQLIETNLKLDALRNFDRVAFEKHHHKVLKANGRAIPDTVRSFKDAADAKKTLKTKIKSFDFSKEKVVIDYHADEVIGYSFTKEGDVLRRQDVRSATAVLSVDYVIENSVLRPSLKLKTLYPNSAAD